MKVSIGYHIQSGAWGGGNQFALNLSKALVSRGHTVTFNLADNDIDIILLTDPRGNSHNVSFGPGPILRYLLFRNSRAIVIHRINECDERKSTRFMNRLLYRSNYLSDHTVFIAAWLKDLPVWTRESPSSIILNGADQSIFKARPHSKWDRIEKLRLVTHHWGPNIMKGFDIYRLLDDMMSDPYWKNLISFTYIGNLPPGFSFHNTQYVPPLSGNQLASELSRHHVYLTASINEPAGMHHIEGALCGLPLLYRISGALPEYCSNFGIGFTPSTFETALSTLMLQYDSYYSRMSSYPHTAHVMCNHYISLAESLHARSSEILLRRNLLRNPLLFVRNLISS